MNETENTKFNSLWLGFIIGTILPIIAMFIFYSYSFKSLAFGDFIMMIQKMEILTQTLTFCILPSFLAFFAFFYTHKNRAAQGVVLATMLLTID